MSKKKQTAAPELPIPEIRVLPVQPLQMRLGAGRHAVKAAEVEIRVDGARLAGGNGIVEFDLFIETWIDIVVIRP